MRIRNFYGPASTAPANKTATRSATGPRRPITSRGREVLEASRRRTTGSR